ncbi:MAG: VanZ family protein [Lachnospiraceae bacterium]|nr:VanZ family protein [Lachnospiraceae bacterium]
MRNKHFDGREAVRYMLSALLLLIIIGIYVIIFIFSEQAGETSGGISYEVSKQCVELLDKLSWQEWSVGWKEELAQYMEHPIRKLAHFGEYGLLSLAIFLLWRLWRPWSRRVFWGMTGWIMLSAAADEIHQYFVPDRNCSMLDVCIDTCGGIFGLFVGLLVWRIISRKKKRHLG